MSNEKQHVISICRLIGCKVANNKGEHIGKLEDLFFDMDHSRIMYAILSIGNFFNLEKKHFAFPLDTLSWEIGEKPMLIINLDLDKDLLARVPGVEDSGWSTSGVKSVGTYLDSGRWVY